jgi:hypothetical protein
MRVISATSDGVSGCISVRGVEQRVNGFRENKAKCVGKPARPLQKGAFVNIR